MLLALLALAQLAPPAFQKFDRLQSSCTIKTEIKASNGKDSAWTLSLDLTAEAEKSEGAATTFDCGLSRLRVEGTLDGRRVDADWSKGSGWKGDAKVAGIEKALDKGWKMTLEPGKGTSVGDGFLDLADVLPVFNPGALLGYPVPPPPGPVAVEKGWPGKSQSFPHAGGYAIRATGFYDFSDGALAKVSGVLVFGKADTEIPIEGAVNVKGNGIASMELDVKTGRPRKGASSAKISITQGGLKKEVSQIVEFEMK